MTAQAEKCAQERLLALNPDGKPFMVLTSIHMKNELATFFDIGQEAGECQLRQLLIRFLGVASTCKRENNDDWMLYLAHCINEALEALNENTRVEYASAGKGYLKVVPKEKT